MIVYTACYSTTPTNAQHGLRIYCVTILWSQQLLCLLFCSVFTRQKLSVIFIYKYNSRATEVLLNLVWLVYSWNCSACTTSPAVVKCCQLDFKFLPVRSQLDTRPANVLQKFIASENSLCCLFALTARRKLNEQFVQFNNVTTACQFYNAILDSLNLFKWCFEFRSTYNRLVDSIIRHSVYVPVQSPRKNKPEKKESIS